MNESHYHDYFLVAGLSWDNEKILSQKFGKFGKVSKSVLTGKPDDSDEGNHGL